MWQQTRYSEDFTLPLPLCKLPHPTPSSLTVTVNAGNKWCVSLMWCENEGERKHEIYCFVFFRAVNCCIEKHKCIICFAHKNIMLGIFREIKDQDRLQKYWKWNFFVLVLFFGGARQFLSTSWMTTAPLWHFFFFLLRYSELSF